MKIWNNVNWSYYKQFFLQAVISSWFNLEKTIFKAENKTIYTTNNHLRHLKFAEYCVQELEKLYCWGRRQEAQFSVNREGQRENKILSNNPWVFDIFVLLPAIIIQYLYNSVWYALKVWISFNFELFLFRRIPFEGCC